MMRALFPLPAMLLAASWAAPAVAQDPAIFMCRFQNTIGGKELAEARLNFLVEPIGEDKYMIEADDPASVLGDKKFTKLEGDLGADIGERQIDLLSPDGDLEGYLLTMGSGKPPKTLSGGPEILVAMLGQLTSRDPRQGQCLMMAGNGARQIFEEERRATGASE
jgi:hypothetical protein